jgi:hypothetical protein
MEINQFTLTKITKLIFCNNMWLIYNIHVRIYKKLLFFPEGCTVIIEQSQLLTVGKTIKESKQYRMSWGCLCVFGVIKPSGKWEHILPKLFFSDNKSRRGCGLCYCTRKI